jgi:hypothetical protein
VVLHAIEKQAHGDRRRQIQNEDESVQSYSSGPPLPFHILHSASHLDFAPFHVCLPSSRDGNKSSQAKICARLKARKRPDVIGNASRLRRQRGCGRGCAIVGARRHEDIWLGSIGSSRRRSAVGAHRGLSFGQHSSQSPQDRVRRRWHSRVPAVDENRAAKRAFATMRCCALIRAAEKLMLPMLGPLVDA